MKQPLVIAGPCSAESREQVLSTAQALAAGGIRIFRASVWKPRTRPGGFEGVGSVAFPWLQEARALTGMQICTEVATPQHVEEALVVVAVFYYGHVLRLLYDAEGLAVPAHVLADGAGVGFGPGAAYRAGPYPFMQCRNLR